MRPDPLPATRVLQALELYGPQARPYNFDDMFDCWGLVRRVVDWLDDGAEANDELRDDGSTDALWRPIRDRDGLLPGDLLVSHRRPHADFHTAFFCGRAAGHDLVYDSSPRGRVPLFDADGALLDERVLFTRFMRATETTDRLCNDGGAYLRLWDERQRFYHGPLHDRLAADPGRERDPVRLRRAAGLSHLPFYCTTRLATDARGREVYDNLWSRDLDYYVPDGAPVLDGELAVGGRADPGRGDRGPGESAAEARPARPVAPDIVGVPHRILREGDWAVDWCLRAEAAAIDRGRAAVDSWHVEVWEETADLWRHRLLRTDLEAAQRRFAVPADLLHDDGRFAVVVWAHGEGGFSGDALTTALWRPSPDNELLGYNANRPRGLWPDGLAAVAASDAGLALTWSIAEPTVTQSAARVRLLEDACLADDVAPVFDALLEGPAATCCCAVPADVLRAGHTYAWYVDVRDATGRWCYAPAEGVFRTKEDS